MGAVAACAPHEKLRKEAAICSQADYRLQSRPELINVLDHLTFKRNVSGVHKNPTELRPSLGVYFRARRLSLKDAQP